MNKEQKEKGLEHEKKPEDPIFKTPVHAVQGL